MSETPSLLDFSDADLKATLRRALQTDGGDGGLRFRSAEFSLWMEAGRSIAGGRGGVGAQDCTSGNS